MTSAARPIDVLLVEDDPGDELITREAFEHNKIKNNLHVAHDGEEGLDFLYRRGAFENAPDARPDPARPEPAEVRRSPAAREDQVRSGSQSHPPSSC